MVKVNNHLTNKLDRLQKRSDHRIEEGKHEKTSLKDKIDALSKQIKENSSSKDNLDSPDEVKTLYDLNIVDNTNITADQVHVSYADEANFAGFMKEQSSGNQKTFWDGMKTFWNKLDKAGIPTQNQDQIARSAFALTQLENNLNTLFGNGQEQSPIAQKLKTQIKGLQDQITQLHGTSIRN